MKTRGTPATQPAGFADAFRGLREILAKHAAKLVVVHDTPDCYYLDTPTVGANKKPMFFGAVRAGKGSVGFHLMPVYVKPELLDGISDELRKRMQGKSCFNFKEAEPKLFKELASLTAKGLKAFREAGYV
jgi:hypothetical protein